MNVLLIGTPIVAALLIIAFIVRHVGKSRRNTQNLTRLKQHGKRVSAQVREVKTEQGWKEEDHSHWNAWEGRYEQARTWQTLYTITATWPDPQTMQTYTFHLKVWANELVSKPETSSSLPVVFDPKRPERYYVDLKMS